MIVYDVLHDHHAAIRQLLDAVDRGRRAGAQRLPWRELKASVEAGLSAEERYLFQPLSAVRDARRHVDRARGQRADIEALAAELDALRPSDQRWDSRFGLFRRRLQDHFAQVEWAVFRQARHALEWDYAQALGVDAEAALAGRHVPGAAKDAAKAGPVLVPPIDVRPIKTTVETTTRTRPRPPAPRPPQRRRKGKPARRAGARGKRR
jgi:hypothetical protein